MSKTTEVTKAVTELIGLDYEQFTRIAMIAQGEFRRLLLADTKERSEIFRRIFHTDIYRDLQAEIAGAARKQKEKYEEVLSFDNVVGLSIGTRPDCLSNEIIDYLAELNTRTYLWVEMGLQTIHEQTARNFNRAYDYAVYVDAVSRLRAKNIRVCCHIINGLPKETREMMLETVKTINQLDIQGIKIHLLHLLKHTPMVKQWENGELRFLEKEEYISLVCDQLEWIRPEIIIHRLTGDAPRDLLIGPMWSLKKWEVLNAIDAELNRRNTYQGNKWLATQREFSNQKAGSQKQILN